jgi:putative transposase
MAPRAPFAPGEWYHCYHRGVDKRRVFTDEAEYRRLELLLYMCNGVEHVHPSNVIRSPEEIFIDPAIERGEPLVHIGAYALMPNHIHLLMREARPGGISAFMQKVLTGYTMYFNKKHARTGPLFAGVFKSKHVADDRYFKRAWSYIHLNPGGDF